MKISKDIQLQNIWPIPLRRDGLLAKSDIWGNHCRFQQGQHHLVLAPSGRGKSTLIHLLYGLRQDYEGQFSLLGEEASTRSAEQWLEWRRTELAIVFQDLRLFPQLTAWENIEIKSQLGSPLKKEQIIEMCHSLEIDMLFHQKAGELSLGQQQRVALVRALVQPFSFLLLDEPFSHLDATNIERAIHLILAACKREQAGMILVSLGEDYGLSFDQHLTL